MDRLNRRSGFPKNITELENKATETIQTKTYGEKKEKGEQNSLNGHY